MKSNSKKKINPISVILGIIAALFLIYGVYMVVYSVDYVMSYGQNSVSTENAIQYVVTSSMAYFGFCGVFFTGACILQSLTDMKRRLAGNFQIPAVDMKEIVVEKPEYIEENDDEPDKEEQPPAKNQQEPTDRISSSFIKNIFEEKNQ